MHRHGRGCGRLELVSNRRPTRTTSTPVRRRPAMSSPATPITPAVPIARRSSSTKRMRSSTVNGYTGVFDGQAHGATGSAVGVKGESLAGLNLGNSFTNVPGGTAHWTFTDQTGNYNNKSGDAAIVITKAEPTVTVNGYGGVYNGQPHGAYGHAKGVLGEAVGWPESRRELHQCPRWDGTLDIHRSDAVTTTTRAATSRSRSKRRTRLARSRATT